MRTSYRNNFLLFVIIHLLVFLFPLASKTLHVHHSEHGGKLFSTSATIGEPEDYCPIFDFDFYSFLAEAQPEVVVELEGSPVFSIIIPVTPEQKHIRYFSLRAPPAA